MKRSILRLGAVLYGIALMACGAGAPAQRQGGDTSIYACPVSAIDCNGFCGDGLCSIDEQDTCPEDCGGYYEYCGNGLCGSYETCTNCPYDCGTCNPNVINVPGVPQQAPVSELYTRAQSLGVAPLVAGVPNISQYLQSRPAVYALNYPTGATGTQDFVNRLFQSGIWQNTGPGQTVTPLAPDANGCQLRQVDERYNPEELVSFDAGAGLLYPGALNQGAYVNLGLGSLTPIHVPYTKRQPTNIVGTFYQSGTAPTATATDVYNTIGQMIYAAQQLGGITQSTVYFDMQSASSLEEASVKFKLDAKLFGATINSTFSNLTNRQSNTVFVKFTQSLFSVFVDLLGYTPAQGLFNSSMTPSDLEQLGNMGELGYDNLPTYTRSVTYGRMLIFSVTSTSSKEELSAAVNAVFGKNSASASVDQKKIVSDSEIRIFAYGGPAEPQIATIRSGNWQDYFSLVNVPLITLKPLGYEVRRWDNQLATMSRTTRYSERTCPPVHKVRVELSDVYKTGTVYVRKTGSTNWDQVFQTGSYGSAEINSFLVGSDDEVRVAVQVGQPGFLAAYQSKVRLKIFVDGVERVNEYYSCKYCHSKDPVWVYNVNQYTGDVIRRY